MHLVNFKLGISCVNIISSQEKEKKNEGGHSWKSKKVYNKCKGLWLDKKLVSIHLDNSWKNTAGVSFCGLGSGGNGFLKTKKNIHKCRYGKAKKKKKRVKSSSMKQN